MLLTIVPTFYYLYNCINVEQCFDNKMTIRTISRHYNAKVALLSIFVTNYILLTFFAANDITLACITLILLFTFHYSSRTTSILMSIHHGAFHVLTFYLFLLNIRSLKWILNEIFFVQRLTFLSYLLIASPLLIALIMLINTKLITKTYSSLQNDIMNHEGIKTTLSLFAFRNTYIVLSIIGGLLIKVKYMSLMDSLKTSLYTLIILSGFVIFNMIIDKLSDLLAYRFKYEALKLKYLNPPKQSALQQELRQLRHDYQKTLSLLKDTGTAKSQTFAFTTETKNHSNHEILNTLIHDYDNRATVDNICFKGTIYWDYTTKVDPFDVLRIFQNALENAFEATIKCEKRSVEINTYQNRDWITYAIENSYDGRFNKSLTTSKQGDTLAHGYGTRIIKSRMAHYHGFVDWTFNEESVVLTLKFPKNPPTQNPHN